MKGRETDACGIVTKYGTSEQENGYFDCSDSSDDGTRRRPDVYGLQKAHDSGRYCREQDFHSVQRFVNKEIRELLDRENIHM